MKRIIILTSLLAVANFINAEEVLNQQQKATLIESEMAVESTSMPTEIAKPQVAALSEQSGFSKGSVVRAVFTRSIADREPTENLQTLSNENEEVKFFTELRDMSGHTAIHRWEYEGKVVAEIKFDVKGPRWRVWSSKSFVPQWTGDWKVSVVNGAGDVISETNLSYEVAALDEPQKPMTNEIDAMVTPK
ncbi:MAG: DUF2914 domain-containing protein [Woeseiaceae bacterium]